MSSKPLPTVYLASSSKHKYNDYKYLLGNFADLHWFRLIVDEPLTDSPDILVRRKLEDAREMLPHMAFFIEQTALVIHAWDTLPGTVTGLFMDSVGNEGICRMLKDYTTTKERQATATTYLGYHSVEGQVSIFHGSINGKIATEPRGDNGYGWDAIFIPDGYDETFAEMSDKKKADLATRILATNNFYTSVFESQEAATMAQNRAKFLDLMTKSFSKSELEDLSFQLGLDPDDIPGEVKREKARELILYFSRRQQSNKLVEAVRNIRAQINWPNPT